MLDRRFILENTELVAKNIAARQMNVDLGRFVALEEQRRAIQQQIETVRAEANALAKNRDVAVEDKRTKGSALKQQEAELQTQLGPIEEESEGIYKLIPNLTYEGSPEGGEEASAEIAFGKNAKREFAFAPLDHITLMEKHKMLDLAAGAKVSGSGFYYFTGPGAMLELAMTRYALDKAIRLGFTPVITPDIARDELMQGAGFVPRGNESNTYRLEDSDLNLIATSEITLVGMQAGEIIPTENLPICVAGMSHCFRSERAHGSATRGIYRVHQFTKVEMVVLCTAEEAEGWHLKMRALEEEVFDDLGVPFRVLEIATGDLGASAYRKFDLEAWMPGRNGGSWGEVTSTSNCTDFQARRLNIRHRKDGDKPQFVHTLNGTAISICRAMIALVENNQQEDGSIAIPAALVPYFGAERIG